MAGVARSRSKSSGAILSDVQSIWSPTSTGWDLPHSRRFSQVYQHPNTFQRRHSVSSPRFLNAFDALALKEPASKREEQQSINSYFENTQARRRSFIKAGKNLQNSSLAAQAAAAIEEPPAPAQWPLIVVEFKAGRTDFFYSPDSYKVGDLCIVEADRGKDLGKVIHVGIANEKELEAYQLENPNPLIDAPHISAADVQPKRIFRHATESESSMLIAKSQDETKAATVCQLKIRQRIMPFSCPGRRSPSAQRKRYTCRWPMERLLKWRICVGQPVGPLNRLFTG